MIAGQQMTSTLRLVRELGKGAMGSVWVADHLALGTQVAVKFMSPTYADQGGFVERFRREAMAAAQIKSPHVAQVFDHGVTPDGMPYIVMELLEGEDLKRRLQRLGALPPAEVALIVSQTAKALGRAHQLGIVHRDIKPDNIFLVDVEGEPFVKVLDFGVAKGVPTGDLAMTSTGSMLGTPLYMSPEQLLSAKHVDFRADLWGLAVVAYHALTGQVPFWGETLGALSVALHQGVFAPPSTVKPGLSPAIDAWMKRALELDPAARFGSAREMAEALERAVLGGPRLGFTTVLPPGGDRGSQPALAGVTPYPVGYAGAPAGYGASQSAPGTAPAAFGVSQSTPEGAPAFGISQSAPGAPASGPGARLSTTGAPGRTLAGMATSGHDTSRRWAPALIATTLALGALLTGGLLYLASNQTPDIAATEDAQATADATPGAAQPAPPPVASSQAAAPASSATAPASATTPEPADAAATAQGTTAPAQASTTAAQAGTAPAQTGTAPAQAGTAPASRGVRTVQTSAPGSKPSATVPPQSTAGSRGGAAPKGAATGGAKTPKPHAPEIDTIGF